MENLNLNIDNVEQLYVGFTGCRCGCMGKYLRPSNQEDLLKIHRYLNKFKSGKYDVEVFDTILQIDLSATRVACLYLKN